MSSFPRSVPVIRFLILASVGALAGCANYDRKVFRPVVTKVGSEVKAISAEDAKTVCQTNYCEDNQVYISHFGRSRRSAPMTAPAAPTPASPPGPIFPPSTYPNQPSEQLEYSRAILNMNSAWSISEGSPSVTVAVIDSGVDYFHPDLKENIAVNTVEKSGSAGVDNDRNGFVGDIYGWDFYHGRANGYDDNGHGTHCAGIIGASKNGIGVRGIAPRVSILPVKFLGPDGSGDTVDAINAIDYAVARGARILSNSWGGGGYSKLLDDAVQRAINKGVIFVAAAGNNSLNNDETSNYPADYPGVISVGSSDSTDERSSFSNYGKSSVEIFAPGTAILSTYPSGQYRALSGTSMAAPQVSGAIALGLSIKGSLTRNQIVADLCDSAVGRLGDISQCGRMDVGDFVRRVSSR